jgi:hypothetical protein
MIVAQQKFLSEIFAEHPKFCILNFEFFRRRRLPALPTGRQAAGINPPSEEKVKNNVIASADASARSNLFE